MSSEPVRINIYDMYWVNEYVANIGVGVFHSGVEVYGIEYSYGGHPFECTGIFDNTPRDAEELGENFAFRESVELGSTDFTAQDVERLVNMLGDKYSGNKYHLISNNCNHFAADLAKELCGAQVPGYINRLASISNSIPFLERMLPQEWLTPMALQQTLEERRAANAHNMINASSTVTAQRGGNSLLFNPPSSARLTASASQSPAPSRTSSRWNSLTSFLTGQPREGKIIVNENPWNIAGASNGVVINGQPRLNGSPCTGRSSPRLVEQGEDVLTQML